MEGTNSLERFLKQTPGKEKGKYASFPVERKCPKQSSRVFNWGTAVNKLPLSGKKSYIMLHIKAVFYSFCSVCDIS